MAVAVGLVASVTPPRIACLWSAQQPPRSTAAAFRVGVELVSLNVTVVDATNHYVTDLKQGDFNVFEDGVKQDVTFFNKTNLPIALSILLDTSASMENKLQTAQDAAVGFARRLRPQDLAEVIDFDSRVVVLQNFTNNAGELEQAIRKTAAGGSTSLQRRLHRAEGPEEGRREKRRGDPAPGDRAALRRRGHVEPAAVRRGARPREAHETAIYTIGLRAQEGPATGTKGFKEAEFVLRQLAQETGGRAFFPLQVVELSGIYGQISDELSSQYTLGYTSKNPRRDGAWRRIVVRVNRPSRQRTDQAGILRADEPLGKWKVGSRTVKSRL